MKIANLNRLLFFSLLLVLLLPVNNLLATNLNSDTNIAIEVKENSILYSLIFKQEIDKSKFSKESILAFKELAIYAAKNDDVLNASKYAGEYIKFSGNTGFLESGYFNKYFDHESFIMLREKYSMQINWLHFFYLFSSLAGFFIGITLLLKRNQDKKAKYLVSAFVFINSSFIFHLFLYLTNLQYKVPHILYMSSLSVYLYGPLIYFYYKRVSINYKFRKIDFLHAIPTIVIFVLMLPILLLPGEEKLRIMLEVGMVDKKPYLNYIVTTKILSLAIYGFLILKVYLNHKSKISTFSISIQKWLRTLVVFTEIYVVSYLIYGLTIIDFIPKSNLLFNFQIITMASMVLYIGFSSFLSPKLFSVESLLEKNKYKKSGLTIKFSEELRDKLLYLLEEEKIYRMNNINLNYLSERLGTSRHNTSQIINEHFNLNFFELINKFRINEASEILKMDTNHNLNIIDVAYEVGFNNKVTFNKSFKKFLETTPSGYILALHS